MIQMLGGNRIFDSLILEDSSSTATERLIDLYGVESLNELINKPLLVQSANDGEEDDTVIKIVHITDDGLGEQTITVVGEADLYVFDNDNNVISPFENWIRANQPYFLVYDGEEFNAYPVSNHSNSGGSDGPRILDIPYTVLSLQNSSTQAQITEAFGGADEERSFQSWLTGNIGPIRVTDVNGISGERFSTEIVDYRYNNSGAKGIYIISLVVPKINNSYLEIQNIVLQFEKVFDSQGQEIPNLFDKVTVYNTTISDGNGVAY